MKKFIIRALLVSGLSFLIGFYYTYHLPSLKVWAIEKIEHLSNKTGPAKILVSNINFHLFPIGVSFKQIRIIPKESSKDIFDESLVGDLSLYINPFSFLTGFFQLSRIEITNPKIHIKSLLKLESLFPKSEESSSFDLKSILKIPLSSFVIHRLNLIVDSENKIPKIFLNNFSLVIENQKTSALISFITSQVLIQDKTLSETPIDLSIGSRVLIQPEQVLLSALKLKKDDSYVLLSGYSDSSIGNIDLEKINLKVKTHLKLQQLRSEILPFISDITLPEIEGWFESQTTINSALNNKDKKSISLDSQFRTRDLKIEQYYIGKSWGSVKVQDNQITSPLMQIENSMGLLKLENLSLLYSPNLQYSAQITSSKIELQELLKNLGLGVIDVKLGAGIQAQCKGEFIPKNNSLLKCEGNLGLSNLHVYHDDSDIVKFEKGKVLDGKIEIFKTQITASGKLEIGEHSKGFADGYVDYKNGFNFDYKADEFDFSEVNIANLGFEGKAILSGHTSGDSHKGIFNIKLEAQDLGIYKYKIGNFKDTVNYKSGTLSLHNFQSLLGTSKLTGSVDINLAKSQIHGNIKSSYLELSDIQTAIKEQVPIPVTLYGGGEGEATFSGPLDFYKLSYNLKSKFFDGTISNEIFDELIFQANSDNGLITFGDSLLKKSTGIINLKGQIKDNIANLKFVGENLNLQSFNALKNINLDIDSKVNFDLALSGSASQLETQFNGLLTQTRISQSLVPDSKFSFNFGKDKLIGDGHFLGKKIETKFNIPYVDSLPMQINAKFDEWDFAPLLGLISSKSRSQEYSSSLSGSLNIHSPSRNLWESSGALDISKIMIKRGLKEMHNESPIEINIEKGSLITKNFILSGENTTLEVRSSKSKNYPLNFDINGKLDLGLLSFMTPFFDDFRGNLALTLKSSIGTNGWELTGSSFVNNGSVRIDSLPHSFENIKADILFNDHKISINKLTSSFASGSVDGHGDIKIENSSKATTSLFGNFKNVHLEIPENVSTQGSGEFQISGDWFPYALKGNYIIQDGLYSKQIDSKSESSSSLIRSQILPKTLTEKVSEVVLLDMDVIFSKGILVKNDLVESKAYGKVHILGPPNNPNILGNIQFQKNGKIFFKDTVFEIDTADLKFNDPLKINPDINISANTVVDEIQDNRTQRYEINMFIHGKPSNYTINLTSLPAKSEKDIISLLTLGVTTESYTGQPNESQITQQSFEVGGNLLIKNKLGREIQDKTGLAFKVSSAVDSKNNTAAPKITISKQWSPKIETSTSRTFGESSTQDVKVSYKLNKNVSLVGSWEGRENVNTTTLKDLKDQKTTDILGLDIDYKLEFK